MAIMKPHVFKLLIATIALSLALPALAQSPEAIRQYNAGIQAYQRGNAQEAIKLFVKATQADPNYANAHYNLGSLYYQTGRFDQAKSSFERAVALDPNDSSAKYNLALTLEKLHQYEQAIQVLGRIPAGDPKALLAQAKMNELRALLPKTVPTTTPHHPPKTAPATATATPTADFGKVMVETFSRGYSGPTGMAFGPGGFMYVSSFTDHVIYKVGVGGEKQPFAKSDQIKGPMDIAYNDKTNELYVVNYLLNNVVRITAEGQVSELASGLKKPYNLLLDTQNDILYVSEQETNTVARIKLP